MTELEKQLAAGLMNLSKQYEADMRQQQAQALQLQQQVQQLASQVISLSQRVEQLTQLQQANEAKLRQDLGRTFNTLSAQLKDLSES